jgi:Restriction Enzyme Adenine Methylase Associated
MMSLFPRRKKHSHKVATLLQDGQVEVDGVAYSSASDAASAIAGKRTNGWWFFLTDQASRQSLRQVRDGYVNAMAVDVEDDEADDDEDEE